MTGELNVDHSLGVLADFRASRGDWFYAFRWMPSRFYKNRLISRGSSPGLEALYRAHRELSPQTNQELLCLTPAQYRARFRQIMEEVSPSAVLPEEHYQRQLKQLRDKNAPRKASLEERLKEGWRRKSKASLQDLL